MQLGKLGAKLPIPLVIANYDGFYDGLLSCMRETVAGGFLEQSQLDSLHVGQEPAALLQRLHRASAAAIGPDDYRDI